MARARAGTVSSKGRVKGKRAKGLIDTAKKPEEIVADARAQAQSDNWGLLEPLHGLLGPIVDIFKPFINANMVIAFLLLFIVVTWLRSPRPPPKGQVGFSGLPSPERIAAYDEIWRREESDLWDWLEERIRLEGISYPASSKQQDHEAVRKARTQREQSVKGRGMQARLATESMKQREIDHAIKLTEERLQELKGSMQRKREPSAGEKPSSSKEERESVGDKEG